MPSRHVFLILRHIWITPGVRPYKVPAGITRKDLLRVVFVTFLDHRQLKKGNFGLSCKWFALLIVDWAVF